MPDSGVARHYDQVFVSQGGKDIPAAQEAGRGLFPQFASDMFRNQIKELFTHAEFHCRIVKLLKNIEEIYHAAVSGVKGNFLVDSGAGRGFNKIFMGRR
jgi:hypothetical protein